MTVTNSYHNIDCDYLQKNRNSNILAEHAICAVEQYTSKNLCPRKFTIFMAFRTGQDGKTVRVSTKERVVSSFRTEQSSRAARSCLPNQ